MEPRNLPYNESDPFETSESLEKDDELWKTLGDTEFPESTYDNLADLSLADLEIKRAHVADKLYRINSEYAVSYQSLEVNINTLLSLSQPSSDETHPFQPSPTQNHPFRQLFGLEMESNDFAIVSPIQDPLMEIFKEETKEKIAKLKCRLDNLKSLAYSWNSLLEAIHKVIERKISVERQQIDIPQSLIFEPVPTHNSFNSSFPINQSNSVLDMLSIEPDKNQTQFIHSSTEHFEPVPLPDERSQTSIEMSSSNETVTKIMQTPIDSIAIELDELKQSKKKLEGIVEWVTEEIRMNITVLDQLSNIKNASSETVEFRSYQQNIKKTITDARTYKDMLIKQLLFIDTMIDNRVRKQQCSAKDTPLDKLAKRLLEQNPIKTAQLAKKIKRKDRCKNKTQTLFDANQLRAADQSNANGSAKKLKI